MRAWVTSGGIGAALQRLNCQFDPAITAAFSQPRRVPNLCSFGGAFGSAELGREAEADDDRFIAIPEIVGVAESSTQRAFQGRVTRAATAHSGRALGTQRTMRAVRLGPVRGATTARDTEETPTRGVQAYDACVVPVLRRLDADGGRQVKWREVSVGIGLNIQSRTKV